MMADGHDWCVPPRREVAQRGAARTLGDQDSGASGVTGRWRHSPVISARMAWGIPRRRYSVGRRPWATRNRSGAYDFLISRPTQSSSGTGNVTLISKSGG
jgi:hypothetical protein